MEQQFLLAWMKNMEKAREIGARIRPVSPEDALAQAHRCLGGRRESDGFSFLADKKRLDLTLEALAVDKRFTALFSDEEANTALARLLSASDRF